MTVPSGYKLVRHTDGYDYIVPVLTRSGYRAIGERAVQQYGVAQAEQAQEQEQANAQETRKRARRAANLAARRIADRERSMRQGK